MDFQPHPQNPTSHSSPVPLYHCTIPSPGRSWGRWRVHTRRSQPSKGSRPQLHLYPLYPAFFLRTNNLNRPRPYSDGAADPVGRRWKHHHQPQHRWQQEWECLLPPSRRRGACSPWTGVQLDSRTEYNTSQPLWFQEKILQRCRGQPGVLSQAREDLAALERDQEEAGIDSVETEEMNTRIWKRNLARNKRLDYLSHKHSPTMP